MTIRFGGDRSIKSNCAVKFLTTFILMFCMLVGTCAHANPAQATDEAFAALLSMPAAAPQNGYWDFPVPADFQAKTESGLILYLANKQKEGADFNAYRHFGTLLHHAIRAGQTHVAIWLLEHGADPHKPLLGTQTDALELSQKYGIKKLSDILVVKYGLTVKVTGNDVNPAGIPTREPLSNESKLAAELAQARRSLYRFSMIAITEAGTPQHLPPAKEQIAAWLVLKSKMSSAFYSNVMDDDETLASLVRLTARSPVELNKELGSISADVVNRHGKAAVTELAMQSRRSVSTGPNPKVSYTVPAQSWRTLWQFLKRPLEYGTPPGLAGNIQSELWPELFASGYANHDPNTALGCMLAEISAEDLKLAWSRLIESFPTIRQASPAMVLDSYRMVASKGYCWSWEKEETQKKLLFLTSVGVKAHVSGLIGKELENESPEFLAALAPFIQSDQSVKKPRFVDYQPNCKFELDAVWNKQLLPAVRDQETIELIDLPGESECALLIGGYQRSDYPAGDQDSFTGAGSNPTPSCPDPTDEYEVWHRKGDRIERLHTDMGHDSGAPLLMPVKDAATGQLLYLDSGVQDGPCFPKQRLPFLFEWKKTSDGLTFAKSNAPSFDNALFEQCSDQDELVCRGITMLAPGSESAGELEQSTLSDRNDAYFAAATMSSFVRIFRAEQHTQYLDAIESLDKNVLKTLMVEGVPGDWTAEAIRQIGTSGLPLPEKRKRIAWIFSDHAQLANALNYDVLNSLVDWLPHEDWTPIFKVIGQPPSDDYQLASLRQHAHDKQLNQLACDIDHVRGLICGETWGVDR